MKTKLPLILLLVGLAGCQQKSVIDKCVEAQATSFCNISIEAKPLYKLQSQSENQCIKETIKTDGGKWQLECLKAQSGK
jgi:hypothetical protein